MGQLERQQVEGHHLGHESLGGRHANLRPGVGIEHIIAFPSNGGLANVADAEDAGTLVSALAERRQCIGGFSRLGNRDHHGVRPEDWAAITELTGQVHFAGDARQLLDHVFAHMTGI